MAGHIAATAPHLDGTEEIGVWVDVAWAAYMHISLQMGMAGVKEETLQDVWTSLGQELDENGKPRPEDWGTNETAQRGQAAMFAMFGANPDAGAAPNVGEE